MLTSTRHGIGRKPKRVQALWRGLFSLVLLTCLVLVLPASPSAAEARSYEFENLDIEAEVLPDGSLLVVEHRTARFSGPFSGMYQTIRKQPGVVIKDVAVSEEGKAYIFRPGATEYGPAGTYYVLDSPDELYIDWSFSAMDERRTFTISYRVLRQVRAHADVSELYYQFVGNQWEQGVRQVSVLLTLPEGADREDIRAWGHGPLQGEVRIIDARHVSWTVENLPAGTFLEGRVIFPRQLITGEQAVLTDSVALPAILQEEQRWAEQANKARARAQTVVRMRRYDPAGMLMGLLIAAFLAWRWRARFGRPYTTSFAGDYYRELPGDYPPAELGVLWRFGDPTADDFTATILDLARRRFIRIDEQMEQGAGFLGGKESAGYLLTRLESSEQLTPHEQDVLKFLFEEVSPDQEKVSFDDIERFSRQSPSAFQSFWRGWVGAVRFHSERHGFFDEGSQLRQGRNRMLFAAVLSTGIAFVALFHLRMLLTAFGLFLGAVALLITGATLRRRSASGQEDYVRWQAFRRFLQHFSQMDRQGIPALIIWEHYLVYAVTLGVAKEVLKQLEIVFPNLESDGYRFGYGWYYFGMGHPGFYGMARSFDGMTSSLNQSLQNSLRVASSPRSSGGGFGGGFSGGGGFGGGGGGGGVR